MAQDLYSVLGVARGADADTVKRAYRKLAKDLHPDKNQGSSQAEAKFKAVNRAYDVLSDPRRRKLYDEFGEDGLREGFDPEHARRAKSWGRRGGPTMEEMFGGAAGGGGGIGDLFGDLFGGRRGRGRAPSVEAELTVDFAASVRGSTVEIRSPATGEAVSVRIPAGVREGSRVRVPGHGHPGRNGDPGDLILTLHVAPHPHFRREGDDLHLDLPITVAEAYRGAKVRVPTIDGAVSLKVAPLTQGGSVVRLRGKGVPTKQGAGDLYVHFQIQIPTSASADLDLAMDRLAAHQSVDVRDGIEI